MDFDLNDDELYVRDSSRSYLDNWYASYSIAPGGQAPLDEGLWAGIAELGWLGAHAPEAVGGLGLSYVALGGILAELGRVLAPVPFLSTVVTIDALVQSDARSLRASLLPSLISGSKKAAMMVADEPRSQNFRLVDGRLHGAQRMVAFGAEADFALVSAHDETGERLFVVDLHQDGVHRSPVSTFDVTRPYAAVEFSAVAAEPLAGTNATPAELAARVLQTTAILTAFEQIGGADFCMQMVRDYAVERVAYGRQIGSYQAVKHKLVDRKVDIEVARMQAYRGACMLAEGSAEPLFAAAARLAAIDAYANVSRDNMLIHAGIGFTWEARCHLYLRRAVALESGLGSRRSWEAHVIQGLSSKIHTKRTMTHEPA